VSQFDGGVDRAVDAQELFAANLGQEGQEQSDSSHLRESTVVRLIEA
jgi:hypothetical protein